MSLSPLTAEESAAIEADFPVALGRRARGATVEELVDSWGPLTSVHVEAAKAHVESAGNLGVVAPSIKALRNTHHRLAQLLAVGVDEGKAGKLCNYTAHRVSTLKADPAFQELLAYYASNVEDAWGDFVSTAANLSMDFLGLLQQQLDETPEKFSPGLAMEAIKLLADRTGHAPVQRSVNVNVNADMGARMNAAKARLAQAQLAGLTDA